MWAQSFAGDASAKRGASKRALALAASTAALVAGLATSAAAAPALPSGGHVGAGSATISTSGATETIDQTSSKAIIDWSSFRVGKSGTVQFDNGSGATLNEVSGGSAAQIQGLLSGTGSVFVIDPAGVVIGRSGVVRTGGTFVASTLDPGASSFLAGGPLTFAGASKAAVVNLGKIGSLGGDVALIGVTVANRGQITAAKGDVGLAAGSMVVVQDRLLDGGKFSVVLGGAGTSATNTGSIQAAEAELRANGGNVYALAGNAGGTIEATGVASNDGKVFLVAQGGTTVAHGRIDATTASGAGGMVETSGERVNFDGLSVRAGDWLVDPYDLTVNAAAATTISNNLATTNVTLKTTASGASGPGVQNPSGAGDIIIAAPIKWNSDNTLTLDAYRSIAFDAAVKVAGAGKVMLTTNDGGSGGDYSFELGPSGFGGSLSFTGAPGGGQALAINGAAYTLLYSMADVANVNTTGLGGDYALATSLDASGTTYTAGLIGSASSAFTGAFTGLGHTISDLKISSPAAYDVGLFALASSTSNINGVGLAGGSVTGANNVGGLVGYDDGAITDAYATGLVTGLNQVGGLAGEADGTITNAYATGAITGGGGGLVGENHGAITNAYATGAVTGAGDVGGLVGASYGPITNAYATGAVTGKGDGVGGLAGYSDAPITNAYATGAVTGGRDAVGGLVGLSYSAITNSYATGAVTGASEVGGLIGYYQRGAVSNSHYDIDQVLINGGHELTLGGLYDGQYQDWYSHGLSLDISTYFGSPDANGFYSVNNLTDLQDILGFGETPGLKFKLTANIDLSSAPGFYIPYFAGELNGQGNTISNLSLDYDNSNLGLVGVLYGGTIANLGVVGGSVSGLGFLGDLVGYATSESTITNAYATGAVSGGGRLGGLVGDAAGDITNAYATGAVTGGAEVGGLVGEDGGIITNAYATGAVTGSTDTGSNVGGLVGFGAENLNKHGYYDADTSGFGTGQQKNGSVGLTTAQLQGALPAGFDSSVWGTGAGLYPYLKSFYPTPPQAISGFAYNRNGSGAKEALVAVYEGGTLLGGGDVSSGANGYFYELVPGGTVGTSTRLGETLTLSGANSVSGLAYTDQPTLSSGNVSGLNITSGPVTETTADASLSVLDADLASTFGSGYAGIATQLASASEVITATGAGGFTIDQSLGSGGAIAVTTMGGALTIDATVDAGKLTLTSAGAIDASAGTVEAATLTGSSVGGADFTGSGNLIGTLSKFVNSGSGAFSLTDSEALGLTGPLTDTVGGVTLTTTSGALNLAGTIDAAGQTLTLDSAGAIFASAASLRATTLTGSWSGVAFLTGAGNRIVDLGSFSNAGTGALRLTDGRALTVSGPVTDTTGNVFLTTTSGDLTVTGVIDATGRLLTLTSAGAIDASGGTLEAVALTGSSVAGADLTGAGNLIGRLASFDITGSGAFSLTDAETLRLTGPLTDTVGAVTLTTTSGALNLAGTIVAVGQTLTLDSAGSISAAPATLRASLLTGSWSGSAILTGAGNRIVDLGSFNNAGVGGLNLSNGRGLTVSGPVTDTTGNVFLTTTSGNLTVTGTINATGRLLTLTSAGAIVTTGATLEDKKLIENPNTP